MLETWEEVELLPGLLSGGWAPLEVSSKFVDIEVKLFGVWDFLCGRPSLRERLVSYCQGHGRRDQCRDQCLCGILLGVVFEIGRMGRVSNEDICNLAGTVLLVARVGTRRLNFFGHLLCVPDSEPVKECAVFVHGRP